MFFILLEVFYASKTEVIKNIFHKTFLYLYLVLISFLN
jgi:hypothetical protein